jgi:chromosome segregation ATPase
MAVNWEAASTEIDNYQAGTATDNDVAVRLSPAQSGTENFITNIRGLAEPDNAAQKAAYASLQKTADALADRSQAIASEVDDLETRATQAQAQIQRLFGDLQTSVAQLDEIYPDADIAADVAGHENGERLHV